MRCTNTCVPVGPSNASRYTITRPTSVRSCGSGDREQRAGSAVVWSAGSVGPVVSVSSAAVVLSGRRTRCATPGRHAGVRADQRSARASTPSGQNVAALRRRASRPDPAQAGTRVIVLRRARGVRGPGDRVGVRGRRRARRPAAALHGPHLARGAGERRAPRVDDRPGPGRRRPPLTADSRRRRGSVRSNGGGPGPHTDRARSARRARRRWRCGCWRGSPTTCAASGEFAGGRSSRRATSAPSFANTRRIISDPLGLLLEHERRFGPVFTIRLLHEPIVWAVGAEVNHQILVSDFDAFSWREGRFADLWPLLGDGMLNIDGAYHREFRMLMLPAFHRDYVAGVAETMIEEAVAAAESLCATGRWSRSTTGPASSRCGSRCAACSGLTAPAGASSRWPRRSRSRWRSTASRSCCSCCRCRGRRWRARSPPASGSTRSCERR